MPVDRFDVEVASRTLVRASDPPRGFPAVLLVSNLDLIFGSFHIFLIAVYPAPTAGFPAVAVAVCTALPSFLSRFYPFAGRIIANTSSGISEVACRNAGVDLVVAHVGVRLDDIDFADGNRSLALIQVSFERGLALSLQLVQFACSGFAMPWGTDHLLVDDHSLTALPTVWADLLHTGGLSWEPQHDRCSLFRPCSPPRYSPSLDAEFGADKGGASGKIRRCPRENLKCEA